MIAFLSLAALMTICAVVAVAAPLLRRSPDSSPVAAVATALLICATVAVTYAVVSDYPWTGHTARTAHSADTLRRQLAENPQDIDGWIRLGNEYVTQERYDEARDAYRNAMALDRSGNDDLRIAYAETAIMVEPSALTGEAGQILDDVLMRKPLDPKALWYGGLSSLSRGDTAAAKTRWSRLLELSPPPQVRQVLEEQIAALDAPSSSTTRTDQAGPTRIPVRVRLAPALASKVREGGTLFLIARAAAQSGPPLAVVRRPLGVFPVELEISDQDAMLAGQSLGSAGALTLTARVSASGDAIATAGDLYGDATWSREYSGAQTTTEILIDRMVK